ncbi:MULTISPECIES: class II fumarate hydratase [Pseudoalteromonas]|uniref:Fumarate hydratase class II n=1 Tax=Pseudoalteromonas amylolytica TaxID=1859457 RepID=A0A1S1N1I2_9GAMM|nr:MULTISPECIES: class II fumarate hydratase [Pseudoalteromonas]OHU84629.1 aspartate ammonia-lyase [Pseudoalteromonas sp. JW3]OHU92462.1 aspartate ammonia-lyase [Pseudoalteromonas amylolytica]
MPNTRTTKDSMGSLEVPVGALYQAQTQRAVNNFPVSGLTLPVSFIRALAYIKQAAAQANKHLNHLSEEKADAIITAAQEVIDEKHLEQFPVDVFQTGSGTSSNMNANEVIATLASQASGLSIHANDDVNMGQSSNDVIPTTIHVSCATLLVYELLPALTHLSQSIAAKGQEVGHYVKTGRTHLMDAMPVSLAQTLSGWQAQVDHAQHHIQSQLSEICKLSQGGTAVGTGINADPHFAKIFNENLSANLGIKFDVADNFFFGISSQDSVVNLSGTLKTLAVAIMKIANDLRWMNSGPLAGLAEIELEALQPGSSIMPGKVNPVIPEAAAMACAQVIGNDTTITVAGQSGNFELNVMLPVIAFNIIQSIEILTNISHLLADKAISSFTVNESNLDKALAKNPILVTALNPIIGYEKAAKIAKLAYKQQRPIIDVAKEHTNLTHQELEVILDPTKLTQGGIS